MLYHRILYHTCDIVSYTMPLYCIVLYCIIIIICYYYYCIITIIDYVARRARDLSLGGQDSSKGVAVETGCSGLHYITGCFTI